MLSDRGSDFSSIESYDCFSGLCAVIRHRLDQRSLEQIKLAAELFNWTIEFGLFSCDTNARASIRVGSAEDVASFLLERILNRLSGDPKRGDPTHQARPNSFELRFLHLAPVLTMLKETVESADWVQNQLALRLFFWIADCTKSRSRTKPADKLAQEIAPISMSLAPRASVLRLRQSPVTFAQLRPIRAISQELRPVFSARQTVWRSGMDSNPRYSFWNP